MSTSTSTVGLCVIYHWKLRPELETQFVAAWRRATQLIMDQRGGGGSRLHKAADGTWYAYAQWPDRKTWQAHQDAGPIDPELARQLLAAEEVAFPPVLLEPVADFLSFR